MPVKHCLLLLVDSALVVVTVSSYGNKIVKKGLKIILSSQNFTFLPESVFPHCRDTGY